MVDPDHLKKYLAGTATDEECRHCEAFLSDPSNAEGLAEIARESVGDSLLETLGNLCNQTQSLDGQSSQSLVERLQSLVPAPKIGQDEIDRVLSPPESSDEIGRIDRYRVIEFIAGGGMGFVFKAEDPKLERLVCIKVLNPLLAVGEDSKTRFAREAKAASALRNSRITTVLEFGQHKDLPYLVMELLDGQSLRDKLNLEGSLDPQLVRKLTTQIAQGLRYAHQRGLLHRDIKPENIWVTPEGDIKLLDFGLARSIEGTNNLTHSGTILGTPNYMSPEQVQGKELDERSDLFSVGSVMFEMLTGEPPFGKSNLFSTMMSVANDTLAFPDSVEAAAIPESLRHVTESLLQKAPECRFESASHLISVLDGSTPIPKSSPSKSRGSNGSSRSGGWKVG